MQPHSAPSNRPEASTSIEKVNKILDNKIEKAEAWKKTAAKVTEVALITMAIGVGLTVAVYASPVIPFALVILIPIVAIFAIGFSIGSGDHTGMGRSAMAHANPDGGQLWGAFLKVSVYGGINLGKAIYTTKVAIIAGLANGALAILTLPVAAGGGIAYFVKHRQVKQLKDLQFHLKEFEKNNHYNIPDEVKRRLTKISADWDLDFHLPSPPPPK